MKSYAIQLNDNDSAEPFDLKVEVLRGANSLITHGLTAGNVKPQNQALILTAYQGDFKENPALGVGLGDALFSNNLLPLRHKIRSQMMLDGMTVTTLTLTADEDFYMEADYDE